MPWRSKDEVSSGQISDFRLLFRFMTTFHFDFWHLTFVANHTNVCLNWKRTCTLHIITRFPQSYPLPLPLPLLLLPLATDISCSKVSPDVKCVCFVLGQDSRDTSRFNFDSNDSTQSLNRLSIPLGASKTWCTFSRLCDNLALLFWSIIKIHRLVYFPSSPKLKKSPWSANTTWFSRELVDIRLLH